ADKAQIRPDTRVANADSIRGSISDMLQPTILGRDQMALQLLATTEIGATQPDPSAKPAIVKQTLVPVANENNKNKDVPSNLSFNTELDISADKFFPGKPIELGGRG